MTYTNSNEIKILWKYWGVELTRIPDLASLETFACEQTISGISEIFS